MAEYWPLSNVSEQEKIARTANYVGLSVPGEEKTQAPFRISRDTLDQQQELRKSAFVDRLLHMKDEQQEPMKAQQQS